MKSRQLVLVFACLIASSAAWRPDQEKKFQEWKTSFKKVYATPEEEEKAKTSMLENDEKIAAHNKKFKEGKESFARGLWKRSDLNFEEKKKVLAGAKDFPGSNSSTLLQAAPKKFKSSSPSSLNWTALGLVHGVEDQRTCGSCYAFASAGVIEGVMLKKGVSARLSVQQMIDCDTVNLGCGGGDPHAALKYAKKNGLATAADYPYLNKRGKCRSLEPISEIASVTKVVLNGNEAKLKDIVANYGPVAVAINAAETLMNYMTGVYTNKKCPKTPDHAVLLVGYGTDPKFGDFWIVKNSWGTSWGEQGYVRMARNKNNICGIANYVWYAT